MMLQEFTSTMEQRADLQASWQNIIVGSEEPIWRIYQLIASMEEKMSYSLFYCKTVSS